jgi:hypothetical protein
MVKAVLLLILIIFSSACCDYYYTAHNGLRSKRLYKCYARIESELPSGIDTNCLYQYRYSIYSFSDGTIDTIYPKGNYLYSRFYPNGRKVTFVVPFGLLDSTSSKFFEPEAGRMGYYRYRNGRFFVYSYAVVDCGSFGKGELNGIEGNLLIFGKGYVRSYDEKIDAPAAWLPPGKPDW